jgi:Flp pilus assembly protein TadD
MDAANQLRELVYASGCHELSQRRLQRASEVFRFMTMFAPDDERAWLGLGEAHLQAGHEEVAAFVLETGSRVAQSNCRCLLGLAQILRANGHLARAREALKAASERPSETADDELARELEQTTRSFES